jgi:predicted O-methyltransferase YrrM
MNDLINNNLTDKNTTHSYIPTYEKLLEPIRESARNVLEIGIGQGGSIKLWQQYFKNSEVYAVDILEQKDILSELFDTDRIHVYPQTDAYKTTDFLPDIKFDMILDDGPHTLQSMIKFIQMYSDKLTDNGILIIEDIQDFEWIDILRDKIVSDELRPFVQVYDLRSNKNRYDDILFVINKTATT